MRPEAAPSEVAGAGVALWRRLRADWFAAVTVVAAVAAPVAAARHLRARVDGELEPALTRATGVPTRIGGVEAGLTGNLVVRDVAVGDLLTAETVEASVSLDSLLAGALSPDEIRVTGPRVRAVTDGAGHSAWKDVLARLAARRHPGGGGGGGGHRLRRIVVSGGDLVAEVPGLRVVARDVELHPSGHGVRLVTGSVAVTSTDRRRHVDGAFERIGADVRLPELAVERAAAVGGRVVADLGGPSLVADAVAVIRDRPDGPWRATATVDDGGAPRALAIAAEAGPGGRAIALAGDRVPLAFLAPLTGAIDLSAAHASGRVTVGLGATADVHGELALTGALVAHPAIADQPVPLDGTLRFAATRIGDRVDLAELVIGRGAATLDGHGWLRWGRRGPTAGELTVALPETPCRGLIDALPGPLRGHLDQLAVRGTITGTAVAAIDLDAELGDGVHLAVTGANRCEVAAEPPGADARALAGVADHHFPDGTTAAVGPGLGDWVDLDTLPAYVRGAFVAAEDARFWEHDGFDLAQIARSLEIDLREERFARGGSTISQQLVKNAFLHQRRTLARKLEEAVLTWRLEAVLSKQAILARYLNVIELGPGVFGVAAAARHWFGRAPQALTVHQAAFLAALTPAPRTISARLATGHKLDPDTAGRVGVVLRAMRRAGVIDAATARVAESAALDLRPAALGR